ncbi:50S ribosomal protein L25/general stress protein Ctc [Cellulomonas sp. ATA003]|uniref:50S ribosomal protein L25/general stress protein Ctc n=1 Tax=Cellulomonas sp. ATA003 TaxID=3073064 RepID=UPI0028733967|nr:50S ribosomal protein L25/general stress protein Ctc [Cellulomonas sp. ATA003]WNB85089.1 50S ribosomal protein L25/general stress protein Ctc [Cellulomonas sp. ATA003]
MSETKLVATVRTDFGKGAARRTRRAGLIPAVLYGHGTDPVHVSLPGHQTFLALKHSNALFEIEVNGTTQLALAKDVQRDPMRNEGIEHVDLLVVNRGEKVSVEVPVHITGESAPGTIHVVETQQVSLEADATNLPEYVEVSVEGLTDGAQVTAGELTLPGDATLALAPETVIVTVSEPRGSAEDDAADAEVAAEQAAASAAAADSAS